MIEAKISQFMAYIFTLFIFITTTTTIFILNYAGLDSVVFSHTSLNVVGFVIFSLSAQHIFIPTICISVLHR
jgi:hypothetical protein